MSDEEWSPYFGTLVETKEYNENVCDALVVLDFGTSGVLLNAREIPNGYGDPEGIKRYVINFAEGYEICKRVKRYDETK